MREKERLLEKWLAANQVDANYYKLKNVLLMEEFQNYVPVDVRSYIADRGDVIVHKAAVIADDYTISHELSKGTNTNINAPKHQKTTVATPNSVNKHPRPTERETSPKETYAYWLEIDK